jgi:hypothetical protein
MVFEEHQGLSVLSEDERRPEVRVVLYLVAVELAQGEGCFGWQS